MDYPTASYDTLLRQASMTAHDYMRNAKEDIDKMFGDGFAAKNPTLVAAYMQAAASDFGASSLGKILGPGLEQIAEALRSREGSAPDAPGPDD